MSASRARNWRHRGEWLGAMLLAMPLAAGAQEAAPSTTEWVFRWLNFVLLFGVGGWWAGKKLRAAFRKNADRIEATIAEAEALRRKAQERLRAADAKLAGVKKEAEEMLERARKDSAAEVERIGAMAVAEAERVERAADAEIEAAERAAVNRMRESAVALTISKARALVGERLTPDIDRGLFRRFAEMLGTSGGKA